MNLTDFHNQYHDELGNVEDIVATKIGIICEDGEVLEIASVEYEDAAETLWLKTEKEQ
jgi:uncharacterized membrane-anchored protein